jgi:hypothetical protein
MLIVDRVDFYKSYFSDCKAVDPVKTLLHKGVPVDKLDALEALRALNTELSDLYMVEIPVITCWVRDSNYVPETREIYLTEPDLKDFLHQFRHHLQNIERRYERRGLTTEGNQEIALIPYQECIFKLRGEDDAIAWSKMLLELCNHKS